MNFINNESGSVNPVEVVQLLTIATLTMVPITAIAFVLYCLGVIAGVF